MRTTSHMWGYQFFVFSKTYQAPDWVKRVVFYLKHKSPVVFWNKLAVLEPFMVFFGKAYLQVLVI